MSALWRGAGVAMCALVMWGAQCPGQGTARCSSDLACGQFKSCNRTSGLCECTDNRGCGRGEFCNTSRVCQPIAGCADNTDCEQLQSGGPLICDVKSGTCQSAADCFSDVHCALGRVCDSSVAQCVEGCRDEGDCALGVGCLRDTPNAVIGRCAVGTCSADHQCKVGEYCDLASNRCVVDERGPFCGACTRFDPNDPQCGEPSNYCLIDTGDPARRSHYCGVDCSQDQGCPNGYTCAPVIIVGPPATPACTMETCANGICTVSGTSCSAPVDCPLGPPGGDCARARLGVCAGSLSDECSSDADCGGSEGACRFAECRVRERAAYGFCSCVVDSDCPADDCRDADLSDPGNPVAGHCLLSGHRCFEGADCDVIACVQGGCRIGYNCKPGMDRRCIDLQSTGGAE